MTYTRNLPALIAFITIMFVSSDTKAQTWDRYDSSRSFRLHNLFFQYLVAFIKGGDSNYYVLTDHRVDIYWEKNNRDKSELLVSRVNQQGEISFVKKLDGYARKPMLRSFNGKYYLLDNQYKVAKRQYYYDLYIYNSNWELESTLKLPDLPHQLGFSDLVVNGQGDIFLLTSPYYIDHRQQDFKGTYLLKYSAGASPTNVLFEKSYASSLQISNDSISLQLKKQKLVYPFYQTDSILEINSDFDLNYDVVLKRPFIQQNKNVTEEVLLSDGERAIFIDSSYAVGPNVKTYTFKVAMLDKQGKRHWTIEPSERWLFSRPKPLPNGTFITRIDKRWDSTSLVRFDKNGQQRILKSFLMNANTRIDRYSFIDYFAVNEREIWIFYKKEMPTREEELYFEKLLLE